MQLADSVPSVFHDEVDRLGSRGTTERLDAVVQARLWAMMQRKLYDPLAARRLRGTPGTGHGRTVYDGDDYEDLLGHVSGGRCSDTSLKYQMAESFDEGFEMDNEEGSSFDDLLGELEDDYDLLNDYEHLEREAVEQETDEMLLLDDYPADGATHNSLSQTDEMLLKEHFEERVSNSGLSSDNESMLL